MVGGAECREAASEVGPGSKRKVEEEEEHWRAQAAVGGGHALLIGSF